jgi:hypothetical protein
VAHVPLSFRGEGRMSTEARLVRTGMLLFFVLGFLVIQVTS